MRLSPTWAMKPRAPRTRSAESVVPIPRLAGSTSASSWIFVHARLHGVLEERDDLARRHLRGAGRAGHEVRQELASRFLSSSCIVRTAIALATSPAAWPPMPSADDEEPELLVDEEVVLVVVADQANVGRGKKAERLGVHAGGDDAMDSQIAQWERRGGPAFRPATGRTTRTRTSRLGARGTARGSSSCSGPHAKRVVRAPHPSGSPSLGSARIARNATRARGGRWGRDGTGRAEGRKVRGRDTERQPSAILPPFRPSCALAYPWSGFLFHAGRSTRGAFPRWVQARGESISWNAERRSALAERRDARGCTTSNLLQRRSWNAESVSPNTESCPASTERRDARGSTTSNLLQRRSWNAESVSPKTESCSPSTERRDARGSTTSNLLQRRSWNAESVSPNTESCSPSTERRDARGSTTSNLLQRRSWNAESVSPNTESCSASTERRDARGSTTSNLLQRRSWNAESVSPNTESCSASTERRDARGSTTSNLLQRRSWNAESVSRSAESVARSAERHATRKRTGGSQSDAPSAVTERARSESGARGTSPSSGGRRREGRRVLPKYWDGGTLGRAGRRRGHHTQERRPAKARQFIGLRHF